MTATAPAEPTLKQLHGMAEKHGLAEIAPKPGDAFNPEHHNAVSQQPAPGISSGAASPSGRDRRVPGYESASSMVLKTLAAAREESSYDPDMA